MYVNSDGVVQTDPKHDHSLAPWPQRQGHGVQSQHSVSRLQKLTNKANATLGLLLVVAVVLSTGLAYAVRSQAGAASPASVSGFGKAQPLGNPDVKPNDEVTAIASTSKADGYWIVSKEGVVYPFGNVEDYGSLPSDVIARIVDIVATPSGKGYWLMASNGNVYTFGDAKYFEAPEVKGVIGKEWIKLLPTKNGNGYFIVGSDGDVMAFGNAEDLGSAKGQLNGDRIIDARITPSGDGYVMLSIKGAVFAFGDAEFFGAVAKGQLSDTATAIAFSEKANGYWILTQNGQVLPFGNAQSFGNAAEPKRVGAPSIDLAIHNSGDGYWVATGKNEPVPALTAGQKVAKNGRQIVNAAATNADANAANPDIWAALRNCEAGGVYTRNTGNGYYGAYQFSAATWRSMNTGYEYAHLAPPEVQDDAARRLQARSGWGQWPACSKKIGVR